MKTNRRRPASSEKVVYNSPLLYDIAFEDGSNREARFLLKMLKNLCEKRLHFMSNMNAVEPMCGSGRLLRRIIPHVCMAIGVDMSESAVNYCNERISRDVYKGEAENKKPRSVAIVGDVASKRMVNTLKEYMTTFDFAFNTINSFRELPLKVAKTHLRLMREMSHRHSRYVLGLHLIPSPETLYEPEAEVFNGSRDGIKVTSSVWTEEINYEERYEIVGFKIDAEDDSSKSSVSQKMRFTNYDRHQIMELFEETGWKPIEMYDFGYKRLKKLEDYQQDCIFVLEVTA